MVPLEVTHTVLFGPSVREATLARVPDPLFTVIDQWMAFFAKVRDRFYCRAGRPRFGLANGWLVIRVA